MPSDSNDTVRQSRNWSDLDSRWVTLQGSVAAGMILVLILPMAFIVRAFIPPLAIAVGLFAIPLALMPSRPRASAIAVGVFSAAWLLLQLMNLEMVIPDLLRPEATLQFIAALGMLVLPLTGVVGLLGTTFRAPETMATRVLRASAIILVVGVLGASGIGLATS